MIRKSLRRWKTFATALALLVIGFSLGSHAQRVRGGANPHSSASLQAAVVQLGVYDKLLVLGEPRAYEAQFVVTGEGGEQYRAVKRATAEDTWVYAEFPHDFDKFPANPGTLSAFRWKCVVEGKTVAGGQFQWGGSRAVAPQ